MSSHKLLDVESERVQTVGVQDIPIVSEIEGEICGERCAWWCGVVR